MDTGGDEAERCTAAFVHFRSGIHVRTGAEQQIGNFDDILWCFLAISFHAVRRDVVEQCRMMLPRRPRPHQFGIVT